MFSALLIATRRISRNRGISFTIVVVLASTIGAFGSAFSVAYSLLTKPLPYPTEERLVDLALHSDGMSMDLGWPQPFVEQVRKQVPAIDDLAAYEVRDFTYGDQSERYLGTLSATVTDASLLGLLGFEPEFGRAFTEADAREGSEAVAIVGGDFADRELGGREGVIGRKLLLGGKRVRVVGVLKRGDVYPSATQEVYLPRVVTDQDRSLAQSGSFGSLRVMARLSEGVSLRDIDGEVQQAIAEESTLSLVARQIGLRQSARPLRASWLEGGAEVIRATLLSTMLLLAIGVAAAYNLFLIRLLRRRQEFAFQHALGASLGRRASELGIEAVLLSGMGAFVGCGLVYAGIAWLRDLGVVPSGMPIEPRLDLATILCIAAVFIVTTVAMVSSGLLLQGRNTVLALREGGGQTPARWVGAMRDGLLILQVALSVFLLIVTGLLVRSADKLMAQDMGIERSGVLLGRVKAPVEPSPEELLNQRASLRYWIQELGELGGVENVALASSMPFGDSLLLAQVKTHMTDGAVGDAAAYAYVSFTSEGYFDAMGINLLRGRQFLAAEADSMAKVAIIDESFEREHFGGDAIGLNISILDGEDPAGTNVVVVGVVGDVRQRALQSDDGYAVVYRPSAAPYRAHGLPENAVSFVVRAPTGAMPSKDKLQSSLAQRTSQLVVGDLLTASELIELQIQDHIQLNRLLRILAIATLILAGVGIYCVIAFTTANRTREIGVRRALGATSPSIFGMVLLRGLRLVGLGFLIGAASAFGAGFFVGDQLFSATPYDAMPYLAAMIVVGLVAIIACIPSASLATKIEPTVALKTD